MQFTEQIPTFALRKVVLHETLFLEGLEDERYFSFEDVVFEYEWCRDHRVLLVLRCWD